MNSRTTPETMADVGDSVPVPGASRRRHDPAAVAAVRDLAAETRTKSAVLVYAYLLGETQSRPKPHHYAYVVEKAGLVARATSNVSIVDQRHTAERGWEYKEYHELRRISQQKDPKSGGCINRTEALKSLSRPLLLTPEAWADDLRDVYDRLHGVRKMRTDGGERR